jgi:serine protease Do
MVSQTPIDTKVKVKLLRNKKEVVVEVVIAELPKKLAEASSPENESEESNEEESNALAGLVVRELTPDLAQRFGFEENEKGVVVVKIETGGKLFEAGIRPGDIILQINQKNIASLEDYKKIAPKIKAKERLLLLLRRKGHDLFVTVRPE